MLTILNLYAVLVIDLTYKLLKHFLKNRIDTKIVILILLHCNFTTFFIQQTIKFCLFRFVHYVMLYFLISECFSQICLNGSGTWDDGVSRQGLAMPSLLWRNTSLPKEQSHINWDRSEFLQKRPTLQLFEFLQKIDLECLFISFCLHTVF